MIASAAGLAGESVLAQEDSDREILFTTTLEAGQLPVAPTFVRLLRITLSKAPVARYIRIQARNSGSWSKAR